MSARLSNERKWLEKMAERETYGSVSAGGLVVRALGERLYRATASAPKVLGRLVELARRGKGMTLPELATKADVELVEALAIESGASTEPPPRTLFGLAKALSLPVAGVMNLAGLVQRSDDAVTAAAVRFAAKAEPAGKLTAEEKEALEEFVKVLAELSERT